MNHHKYDVVIIGGGPGGSTTGSFLKKHDPNLRVGIYEREVFPREHVGESQLPVVCSILDELGAWDKIEACGFPVKIGATYRWGCTDDLWDFNFLPHGEFKEEPRPAPYAGQRKETAFQIDRSIYDQILLNHAREFGCEAFEGCAVREVKRDGDKVTGLVLENGDTVEADYYIDSSGHSGFLRRAMGIKVEEPSSLKNIAIYDYWQNADWPVILGVGGTRIQVMSLGYGWLWCIAIGDTRTSIGLVCPAEYYKRSGKRPEELYLQAIADEPRITALTKNATREDLLQTTKDWSFVAERMVGENWMLVGEASGFADPILSAGLSLTHVAGKEAALSILEANRGGDRQWLFEAYEERNRRKVLSHIRFADYWYTANDHFGDLKEFTREIARDAGLELDAEAAFQWLGTGGFVEDDMEVGGIGGFRLDSVHQIAAKFANMPSTSSIDGYSGFPLLLEGATIMKSPVYQDGRVHTVKAFRRGNKVLPLVGFFGILVRGLQKSPRLDIAVTQIARDLAQKGMQYDAQFHGRLIQTLEAMHRDGWVGREYILGASPITAKFDQETAFLEDNRDAERYNVPSSLLETEGAM